MVEPYVSPECHGDLCEECQSDACTCGCHHIGDEEERDAD